MSMMEKIEESGEEYVRYYRRNMANRAAEAARSVDAGTNVIMRWRNRYTAFDVVGTVNGVVVTTTVLIPSSLSEQDTADTWSTWALAMRDNDLCLETDEAYDEYIFEHFAA